MYSIDTGVEIMIKKVKGKIYMLAVNSDRNPVKVTFSGLDKFNEITVLQEEREVAINKGKFTDYYEPFDVHIYKLQPSR